jgi:prepilin-type N-terminal cleavage/methylation domain-containing protein
MSTHICPIQQRLSKLADLRRAGRIVRTGFTLIEMMVSVALTLIVVLAIVRVFDLLGSSVNQSRSILELSAQLRNAAAQLQADLDRATVTTIPPRDPRGGEGVFEIMEGPDTDVNPSWGIRHDLETYNGSHINRPDGTQEIDAYSGNRGDYSGWYGDADDVLMFTIHSDEKPFSGRLNNTIITSKYAVVVWWVERFFDLQGKPLSFRLHRRLFLVRPDLSNHPALVAMAGASAPALNEFLDKNDLAVMWRNTGELAASSLSDLSERRHRYGHSYSVFPHRISFLPSDREFERERNDRDSPSNPNPSWSTIAIYSKGLVARQLDPKVTNATLQYATQFQGEDVVLSDVLAFNVKVYDPQAPLILAGGTKAVPTALEYVMKPGDPGYWREFNNYMTGGGALTMRGCFVDLFYSRDEPNVLSSIGSFNRYKDLSLFSGPPLFASALAPLAARGSVDERRYHSQLAVTYDTWSTAYERDGVDQDTDGSIDEGTDGIDNNNNGLVDEIIPGGNGEQETMPPYPHSLRGVEVTIRVLEPSSQQVRQVGIVADFTDP